MSEIESGENDIGNIERLIQHEDFNVNFRDWWGWTLLDYAIFKGNVAISELLIAKAAGDFDSPISLGDSRMPPPPVASPWNPWKKMVNPSSKRLAGILSTGIVWVRGSSSPTVARSAAQRTLIQSCFLPRARRRRTHGELHIPTENYAGVILGSIPYV